MALPTVLCAGLPRNAFRVAPPGRPSRPQLPALRLWVFGPVFHFVDPAGNRVSCSRVGQSSHQQHCRNAHICRCRTRIVAVPPVLRLPIFSPPEGWCRCCPTTKHRSWRSSRSTPHRRQLSTKVRLFLDMLVDRFAEEQRWLDATPDR
jgi:hypothetical protein